VVTRTDARSVLAVLQRNPKHFQLLITDWMMPILDGINLVKSIQLFEELDELKIILHTSDPELAYKAFPVDLLEKRGAKIHKKDLRLDHVELLKLIEEILV
jgi:CheY-like chemotaxis protein